MKKVLIIAGFALSIFAMPADARRRPLEQQPLPEPQPAETMPEPALPPPDDTAKFLAGMPLAKQSPLLSLTKDPAWIQHAAYFERAFAKLNNGKLQKLRVWQTSFLPQSRGPFPVAYYMFSGPDFLYVDQFFPGASVYIMCGKESMGPPPDPPRIPNMAGALANLRNAMKSSLTATYFITQDMKVDLQQQELNGTLPILFVFLARADKSIREVAYISLSRDGGVQYTAPGRGGTPGVRISFVDNPTGRQQTLYYFTTDISDGGIAGTPGFMNFCRKHGVGASFLKSSSYLMFGDGFAKVRDFILNNSSMIVQDDSGVPLHYFNREKWSLRLFGSYIGPIELFKQYYQPKLTELYQQSNPAPFGIGFGYQWDYRKSNLIVAERN